MLFSRLGKTVVGLALTRLFNFGHTQSDDVQAKKTAPVFEKNIVDLFKSHPYVFADRNNHLTQHRAGIRNAVKTKVKGTPPVKVLALNWSFTLPTSTIARICGDRVFGRGENHQSLRGDESKSHESIIWRFIEDAQELTPGEVDGIIEMNIEDTPEEAVTRVVDWIIPLFGLERPSKEAIKDACDEALKYQPTTRKEIKSSGPSKPPRYFGLLAEVDLEEAISGALETALEDDVEPPEAMTKMWVDLLQNGRVTKAPHVTIVHSNSLPSAQPLWEGCQMLQKLPTPPLFGFRLSHLLTDGKVMAVTVEELESEAQEGRGFVSGLPSEIVNRLHITVGTRNKSISAYTARE